MLQDSNSTKQRHENFIKKVCETGFVWGLENSEGFATCSSSEYEDEDGDPIELICFWSEQALAKACANEDWSGYKPAKITLSEFIENWCIGMHEDGFLIGTNLDINLLGYEIEPVDLILELGNELKIQKKEIKLENYKHLDDLISEIENLEETDEN